MKNHKNIIKMLLKTNLITMKQNYNQEIFTNLNNKNIMMLKSCIYQSLAYHNIKNKLKTK